MKKYSKPTIEIERLYTVPANHRLSAAKQNASSSETTISEDSVPVSVGGECNTKHQHDEKK